MQMDKAAEFRKRVDALRPKFVAALTGRLERIDANIPRLDGAGADEALEEIRFDIHKTAGAAAAFGLRDLGSHAAETCLTLTGYQAGRGTVDRPTLDASIRGFADTLRQTLRELA